MPHLFLCASLLVTGVAFEIASEALTWQTGLRGGEYKLRPASAPECTDGTLKLVNQADQTVDVMLGRQTLVSHVGRADAEWTDAAGCLRHTRTDAGQGHLDVTESSACDAARERRVLVLIGNGGIQYRAHQGGRTFTCALARQ